jgi:hypothetical protein
VLFIRRTIHYQKRLESGEPRNYPLRTDQAETFGVTFPAATATENVFDELVSAARVYGCNSSARKTSSTSGSSYHQGAGGRRSLRAPPFFMAQADKKYKAEFFPPDSEAERRISFFAHSLKSEIRQPKSLIPVDAMPTFTVLTPHYGEKVCY